jgi:tRNA(Ile2) C34 agmatinyltransferase TiaS
MVHYNVPFILAQIPPPLCPKCGSHRTEIVGRSADGETIVLRCNACGERSRVTIPSSDAAPFLPTGDSETSVTV